MRGLLAAAALSLAVALAAPAQAATVYKWVDANGTLHLSSDKPPAGVKYERITVASSPGRPAAQSSGRSASSAKATNASPAQVAERSTVLASLRNRECVIALEALDRVTRAEWLAGSGGAWLTNPESFELSP